MNGNLHGNESPNSLKWSKAASMTRSSKKSNNSPIGDERLLLDPAQHGMSLPQNESPLHSSWFWFGIERN